LIKTAKDLIKSIGDEKFLINFYKGIQEYKKMYKEEEIDDDPRGDGVLYKLLLDIPQN
jgi:hypothetical protein